MKTKLQNIMIYVTAGFIVLNYILSMVFWATDEFDKATFYLVYAIFWGILFHFQTSD